MALTRESSPVSESGSTSSPQLTPNSKIRAMLAAVDNDSDDQSIFGSAGARLVSSITKTTSSNPETNTKVNQEREEDNGARRYSDKGSEDDEEEEEEIIRPRGRLAAAMRARKSSSEEDVVPKTEDARERVRKMLMAKNKSRQPTTNAEDAGSEESDAPVVSRKRKIRVTRQGTPQSGSQNEPVSPGLFVSPNARKSASPVGHASDSDELPPSPMKNDRFNALVEKKRQEILAREKEAAQQKAKKAAERKRHAELLEEDGEEDGSDDDNGGRRLTQQVRPTRKASKRALEEMHRETQRLSRNQQLAHNAITKKKFTTAELMARFNYRTDKVPKEIAWQTACPTSSSPVPHSDSDMKDTPPTSPASHGEDLGKSVAARSLPALLERNQRNDDQNLPALDETLTQAPSSPPTRLDKGKGKAIQEVPSEPEIPKGPAFKQRPIRIRPPKMADRKVSPLDDSDSDLEIVSAKTPKPKTKMDSIFDRVPAKQAKESHSLHALRMLARLTSPGKQTLGKNKRPSMTTSELQISLQQRARQQATREREERLQALRDKGVIVRTTEERQQEMAEVEDLISKARREGEEIMKREKAAAKKERKDRGELDPLGDSSDDEDWEEDKENIPEEHSASGSDEGEEEFASDDGDVSGEAEDEDEMDLDDDEEAGDATTNPMFDNEAAESDDDRAEAEANLSINEGMADDGDVDVDDEEDTLPVKQKNRRTRNANLISDDEDGESNDDQRSPSIPKTVSPVQVKTDSPVAPNSVLRSATKTFIPGLTVTGPVGLGLTQIFAGTMDESQTSHSLTDHDSQFQPNDPEQDSLSFLRRVPAPELPSFVPTMEEDTQEFITNSQSQICHIPESQPMDADTQGIELKFSQSQIHSFDSLVEGTQMSPFPEATQDVGFQHMTPIRGRFVDAPPSTEDTLVMDPRALPETTEETPIVKKKGKLRRRAPVADFSDEESAAEQTNIGEDEFEINENVFDVMRKASKKKVVEEFDKKNSKAKEMVNEQADESEDEYAGLGGVSDDESGGEADDYIKEMIDDEGGKNIDESKLAAFFADRERANDEKQVEKLYKDITNGMLRRKRGADYDLSDSDDGGEARRRMKRKEFAKMRKALLADERIGKIAENPKRQAFLRAIEDRGSEDEMDFLDDFPEQEDGDSQSQSQSQAEGSQQVIPNSQPTEIGPPKRKRSDDTAESDARLPPHLRRTKPAKKPSNISEIRESLSSLIEEPNAMIAAAESGSESEDEFEVEGDDDLGPRKEKDKENRNPFALRRTQHAVIDRISLKRATSNNVSNNTRLAFAASSTTPGFKVPALLRRATTNNSLASSTSSSVSGGMSATERMAGAGGSDGVKRGGGKNSGVNYFARESERRAAVVKTEKRREQKRFKGAEVRRKVVGGLFGGGKFE